MIRLFWMLTCATLALPLAAQNSGIGVEVPTHLLHVGTDGAKDPIRIEGLRPGTAAETHLLVTDPGTGVLRVVPKTATASTDDQRLSIVGDSLAIEDGNRVALSALGDDLGDHVMGQTLVTDGQWINGDATPARGLFVTDGGQVGIGLDAPSSAFEVNGWGTFDGINLQRGSDGKNQIRLHNDDSGAISGAVNTAVLANRSGNRGFVFATNDGVNGVDHGKVFISGAGEVSVGSGTNGFAETSGMPNEGRVFAKAHLNGTSASTFLGAGIKGAVLGRTIADNTTDNGGRVYGLRGVSEIDLGSGTDYNQVYGMDAAAHHFGSGEVRSLIGAVGSADTKSSGSVTDVTGGYFAANATGTGAVTNLTGALFNTRALSGASVDHAYGIRINNVNKGNLSNYAIYAGTGKVRLRDLGNGASETRVVVADADGVLSTQALPAAAADPEWAHDGAGGIDAARATAAGRVARFDAAGLLRIGAPAPRNFYPNANAAVYAESSQAGTGASFSANPYGVDVYRANDAVTQPVLNFGKSRGSLDAPTPAQSQDKTGRINFAAYDGSGFVENANITAWVPGTGAVATGDAAGELFFATRPWGDTKARTRMTVSADGDVGIGTVTPTERLHVVGSTRVAERLLVGAGAAVYNFQGYDQDTRVRVDADLPVADAVPSGDVDLYYAQQSRVALTGTGTTDDIFTAHEGIAVTSSGDATDYTLSHALRGVLGQSFHYGSGTLGGAIGGGFSVRNYGAGDMGRATGILVYDIRPQGTGTIDIATGISIGSVEGETHSRGLVTSPITKASSSSNIGLFIGGVSGSAGVNYAIQTGQGDIRLGDLAGTGDRMVIAHADGVLSTQPVPAPASGADNLGNHRLTQTLETRGQWINGDASANRGVFVTAAGRVGIGTDNPNNEFHVAQSLRVDGLVYGKGKSMIQTTSLDMRLNSAGMFQGGVLVGSQQNGSDLTVHGDLTASGNVTQVSDSTLKTAVAPIANALGIVAGLDGVYYEWTGEARDARGLSVDRQVGFLAQAVERVLPEAVHPIADGKLGVDYGKVTPVLAKAIQEQQAQIEALRLSNAMLSSEIDELKSLVRGLVDDRDRSRSRRK